MIAVDNPIVIPESHVRHERRRDLRVLRRRHRHRLRARLVALAASRLGAPYVWGATGPWAFDCSGLTQWAYRHIGRHIPRTTWQQRYVGKTVPASQVRRGDLVFSYGDEHVAIYAGHGRVVVAPRTGDVVRREPLAWLPVSRIKRLIRR